MKENLNKITKSFFDIWELEKFLVNKDLLSKEQKNLLGDFLRYRFNDPSNGTLCKIYVNDFNDLIDEDAINFKHLKNAFENLFNITGSEVIYIHYWW